MGGSISKIATTPAFIELPFLQRKEGTNQKWRLNKSYKKKYKSRKLKHRNQPTETEEKGLSECGVN